MRSPALAARTFWATVAVLAVFNVVRGLGIFGGLADLATVLVSFAIVAVALWREMTRADLGLARADVRAGVRWGAGAFALVFVVVIAAAVVPATAGFLDDARADVSAGALVVEVVVGIAIGTVLPEELVFRGVLLGAAMGRWGERWGLVAASLVFGLWHVFPTLSTAGGNEMFAAADSSTIGRLGLVVGAVLTTSVAGAVFGWLRIRSRSLVAPMIAHLSTNGVALVVAWFVVHRPGR
ncbi:MAG: CPBP family intramembrane metalloprotease [Acidimicrobiia bacterium]|nr:CPBP family intramembrane metalloprotease [Acidimicrobiia bacterium]